MAKDYSEQIKKYNEILNNNPNDINALTSLARIYIKENKLNEAEKYYNKILENYREKQNKVNVVQKKIYVDKYKVEDKMEELLKKFNSVEVIEFNNLMKESSCKLETVVIFLALLELIKIRTIQVFQDENFSNILIKRRRDIE